MRNILKSIIKKEFIHIWKDPQTLLIIFIMPLIMLFLYSYAITLEMRNIPTIIDDLSRTPQSRVLIDKISANNFFKVKLQTITEQKVEKIFRGKQARCIVVIPRDYARSIQNNFQTDLQVLIDASDPNAANFINSYLNQIIYSLNKDINHELPVPFTLEPRFFYNSELKSAYFFVPGLIAIILLLISALLTSIAIAREKETGTMEQILVSPVTPLEIVIGKVIPYLTIGFICSLLILFFAVFWFHVPFRGSFLLICLMLILYIFTGLSFGLLISTLATTQRTAMILALMITMLPTIMLSGFIFPVDSMPYIFRIISNIVPATHFLHIIRGIMLKGIGFFDLTKQVLYLTGLSFILILVSVKKFKDKLE